MKQKLILLLSLPFCLITLNGCETSSFKKTNDKNYDIIPLVGENEATDYSKDENWMFKETNGKCLADLLYFYPTVTLNPNYYIVSKITDEMRFGGNYGFMDTASCFKEYTNVFVPYYTQLAISDLKQEDVEEYCELYNVDQNMLTSSYANLINYSHVRTDVYAA